MAVSVEPTPAPSPGSRGESDEEAVRIAREALIEVFSTDLEESVVLTSGRYKLVSFRIWINPHDPRPQRPDKWHSPVWIDAETGAVVPPQMPDWKPMSDSGRPRYARTNCEPVFSTSKGVRPKPAEEGGRTRFVMLFL